MVAGTVAGEMSFLSRSRRDANVVAERDSVLWRMTTDAHDDMGRKEGWAFCRRFEQCLLNIATEERDVLMVRGPMNDAFHSLLPGRCRSDC